MEKIKYAIREWLVPTQIKMISRYLKGRTHIRRVGLALQWYRKKSSRELKGNENAIATGQNAVCLVELYYSSLKYISCPLFTSQIQTSHFLQIFFPIHKTIYLSPLKLNPLLVVLEKPMLNKPIHKNKCFCRALWCLQGR